MLQEELALLSLLRDGMLVANLATANPASMPTKFGREKFVELFTVDISFIHSDWIFQVYDRAYQFK
jgi:hypothetical protein